MLLRTKKATPGAQIEPKKVAQDLDKTCRSDVSFHELVLRACHVYATKRATDLLRNEDRVGSPASIERILWEGHRTVQLYHRGLSARYKFASRQSSIDVDDL